MASVTLGPHFDAFVRTQVAGGRFNNASEVVRAGLRLLEDEIARRGSTPVPILDVPPPLAQPESQAARLEISLKDLRKKSRRKLAALREAG